MLAVGNDELENCPVLGDFILCEKCGKRHKVRYGKEKQPDGTWVESKLLTFYSCGGKSYLVGINGRDIRKR